MFVTVMWSQIDTGFDPIFFAGIYKFSYNIAFAFFPCGVLYAVVCIFARPEAETVGMLCGKDGCWNAG